MHDWHLLDHKMIQNILRWREIIQHKLQPRICQQGRVQIHDTVWKSLTEVRCTAGLLHSIALCCAGKCIVECILCNKLYWSSSITSGCVAFGFAAIWHTFCSTGSGAGEAHCSEQESLQVEPVGKWNETRATFMFCFWYKYILDETKQLNLKSYWI